MKIVLSDAGRRFNHDWIFRHLDIEINPGEKWALLGNNGSGKSTLLQMLAGYLSPSEGSVIFRKDEKEISPDQVFKYITLATPYAGVHEEMTLSEVLNFHFSFKPPVTEVSVADFPAFLRLENQKHKPIRFFSSGMKQRLKLGLAIASYSDLLLLDEPASNLDGDNIGWYRETMMRLTKGRTVIICSNRFSPEYDFCERQLVVDDYKGLKPL